MSQKNIPLGLTFDDVLLIPQKSDISPRKTNTKTRFSKHIKLDIPLVSAAMDTVTENKTAIALAQAGGIGIIHQNMSANMQAKEVKRVKQKNLLVGAAISVGDEAINRAKILIAAGADALIIDTAHGHSKKVMQTLAILKKDKKFKNTDIIAGNIATKEAARDLIRLGADAIKVGIGPGSICTTRIVAGIGVPQLSAIMDVFAEAKKTNTPVIADGGIRYSGDIVKALAAGADSVMLGNMFAGTKQSPGKLIVIKGKKYKIYRGMGSTEAMQLGSKKRYGQKHEKNVKKLVPEGVVGTVEYKGDINDIIHQLVGGLKAGLGYNGAKTIKNLQSKHKFIMLTANSLKENHPHTLIDMQKSANYNK